MLLTGAVATPNYLATQAGYKILEQGGNAVDAAVAAAGVLAVVLPNQCSIGGDIIAAIGNSHGVQIINGSGRAGQGADAFYLSGEQLPTYGAKTVTIPGVVDAWSTLLKLGGSLELSQVLKPALDYADTGFPVSSGLTRAIGEELSRVRAEPNLAKLFLTKDGTALQPGTILCQPELAKSLREISHHGADVFYHGYIAEKLAKCVSDLGGFTTPLDFAKHTSTIEPPISTTWADQTWYTSGPSTQGIGFVQMLSALNRLGCDGSKEIPREIYAILPSLMLAVSNDRDQYIGSAISSGEIIDHLLSEASIDYLIARAQLGRNQVGAKNSMKKPSGDTVAIVAMDDSGTAVTIIQSIFHSFGSGILDSSTGIVLQNRGASFQMTAGPNQLKSGNRPMHTLMPVLVSDEHRITGAHGTMGGKAQAQIHLQLALRVQQGLVAQQVVDSARFLVGDLTGAYDLWNLLVEPGVADSVIQGGITGGFEVVSLPNGDDFGHSQVIRTMNSKTFDVGTDSRADGKDPSLAN